MGCWKCCREYDISSYDWLKIYFLVVESARQMRFLVAGGDGKTERFSRSGHPVFCNVRGSVKRFQKSTLGGKRMSLIKIYLLFLAHQRWERTYGTPCIYNLIWNASWIFISSFKLLYLHKIFIFVCFIYASCAIQYTMHIYIAWILPLKTGIICKYRYFISISTVWHSVLLLTGACSSGEQDRRNVWICQRLLWRISVFLPNPAPPTARAKADRAAASISARLGGGDGWLPWLLVVTVCW